MPLSVASSIFLGLLATGMPIFVVLGLVSTVWWISKGLPPISVPQHLIDHLNSNTLMAIPFFMLTAVFMQRGGVARALIAMAQAWVGHLPGGLALVCVAATTVFAAISGSSVATALAMGTLLVPAMLERGYERHLALGVVGASGTLGVMIPPSLGFIVYAIVAGESVPQLFVAGVVPGLLQAGLFAGYVLWYTRRRGYPADTPLPLRERLAVTVRAWPALILPVIILGGIYSGLVTVTEAAALSAMVALLIGVLIYRETSWRDIPALITDGIRRAAAIMIIITAALLFGSLITQSGVPQTLVESIVALDLKAWQFLLAINLIVLLMGMFLEGISVVLILLPILLPVIRHLGIDPVHFAVILVLNLEIGLLTPPVGLNLYVLSSITRTTLAETVRGVWPFVLCMLVLLAIVTYVPAVSMTLPELIYR